MEYLYKFSLLLFAGFSTILLLLFFMGFNCGSSNDKFSAYPCAPVLNDKPNSYYKQEWYSCFLKCQGKTPRLNAKSCNCECINE